MDSNGLNGLLLNQLRDIYSAEKQMLPVLPLMAKKATHQGLRQSIDLHLSHTQTQIVRLEQICGGLGYPPAGKECLGMKGLLEEEMQTIQTEAAAQLIDLQLIAAAQRIEHYEIAAYGIARTFAEYLHFRVIVELLQDSLDEEYAFDRILTEISLQELLPKVHSRSDSSQIIGPGIGLG